jgi:hypothetical protein
MIDFSIAMKLAHLIGSTAKNVHSTAADNLCRVEVPPWWNVALNSRKHCYAFENLHDPLLFLTRAIADCESQTRTFLGKTFESLPQIHRK